MKNHTLNSYNVSMQVTAAFAYECARGERDIFGPMSSEDFIFEQRVAARLSAAERADRLGVES